MPLYSEFCEAIDTALDWQNYSLSVKWLKEMIRIWVRSSFEKRNVSESFRKSAVYKILIYTLTVLGNLKAELPISVSNSS